MQQSRFISKWTLMVSTFCAIFFSAAAFADHLMITRNFSGAWMQPDHESQGLVLHIAENVDGSKVGVAHWFTFANDLESAWYVAVGTVDGHQVNMKLFAASGIGFLEADIEDDARVEEVGTLNLSFHNCNQGIAAFDTSEDVLGAGEFRIRRLTSLFHARCSGGISDDTPSDKRPEILEVRLHSVRDDITGAGKAKFWQRADRSDFKLEIKVLPDGHYDLLVCDVDVGDIQVSEGEGSVEYRSPEIDSKPLLNFDPRHCRIDVADDVGVALSSGDALLSVKNGPKNDTGRDAAGVNIEVTLTNTGVVPEAQGQAEFGTKAQKSEFAVEIENVPAGSYPLMVGGVLKGQIEVFEDDGTFKGKLKFSNPPKAETLMLDFNPRGDIVEVLQGDAVILESLFPDE